MGLPILFPQIQDSITDPQGFSHSMVLDNHLPLAAWPVSGDLARQRDFQNEFLALSKAHGDLPQRQHTHQHGSCGLAGVLDGISIPLFCPFEGNPGISVGPV